MALPWLGFVDPLVDVEPVVLNGPDALTSPAYATDYDEVRLLGSATRPSAPPARRPPRCSSPPTPSDLPHASAAYLDDEPLGLLATTRLFARIDAAVATTFIAAWRLKFDVGFWRPFQAIAGAATDGNPPTKPQSGWARSSPTRRTPTTPAATPPAPSPSPR